MQGHGFLSLSCLGQAIWITEDFCSPVVVQRSILNCFWPADTMEACPVYLADNSHRLAVGDKAIESLVQSRFVQQNKLSSCHESCHRNKVSPFLPPLGYIPICPHPYMSSVPICPQYLPEDLCVLRRFLFVSQSLCVPNPNFNPNPKSTNLNLTPTHRDRDTEGWGCTGTTPVV